MTLPAELQVGRRAKAPFGADRTRDGRDGWLLKTGSGLQAGYGKGPFGGSSYLGRLQAGGAGPAAAAARGAPRPPPSA
jgi:hypothetical protein